MPKPQKHDFSLKLTRVIELKEGPGVELATLDDAARFMAVSAAVAALGVCGGAGAHRRGHMKRRTSKERQRRWNERYGVTIGCDDAPRFLFAR